MKKSFIKSITFLSLAFSYCVNARPPECDRTKQEILNYDYLSVIDLTEDDFSMFRSLTFPKINRAIGITFFACCQLDKIFTEGEQILISNQLEANLEKKKAELKKIQEYKKKIWDDKSYYNNKQRKNVMTDLRYAERNLFEHQYGQEAIETPEFKELYDAHWFYHYDQLILDECKRKKGDSCSFEEISLAESIKRRDHAIKDFEQLPLIKQANAKNPFSD
jgi:hypothetical protein